VATNVIMLGPPGAGKGTQGERFAMGHRIPRISTGDILRDEIHSGSTLGKAAKIVMDRGELVGGQVMIGIVTERLGRADAANGFVLDGFPRTVVQARSLDGFLKGAPPLVVVNIEIPESALIERLTVRRICANCGWNAVPGLTACARCGGPLVQRKDDGVDVIRERLRVYARETEPLVSFTNRGRRSGPSMAIRRPMRCRLIWPRRWRRSGEGQHDHLSIGG